MSGVAGQFLKPSDALRAVVEEALGHLPQRGWRLIRSGPALKLDDRAFPAKIHFEGDKWNKTGGEIGYRMLVSVDASGLKAWRKAEFQKIGFLRGNECNGLATRVIYDPARSNEYYSWDLTGLQPSNAIVERLSRVISAHCITWLKLCREPLNFAQLGLHWAFGRSFIELALMQDRRDVACKVAEIAIEMMVEERLHHCAKHGLPPRPFSHAPMPLAKMFTSGRSSDSLHATILMHQLDVRWPA